MNPDKQTLKEVPWDAPQRGEVITCDDEPDDTDNLS